MGTFRCLIRNQLNNTTMAFAIPYVGLDEVKTIKLINSLVAEILGTMFLVLVGCGSCMIHETGTNGTDVVRIALAFGVTVATIAQSIGHVSGCHINPAITCGLITGAKIGIVKGILYIVAQCVGALVGAGLLKAFLPSEESLPGITQLNPKVNAGQGVGIELFITFVLVLVVFAAAADENNSASVKGSAPLAIGLSITTCHLYAVPLTGSSMNPARSLGPAIVGGLMKNHWVYWVGPILGGILAAVVYQLLFAAEGPSHKPVATSEPEEKIPLEKV